MWPLTSPAEKMHDETAIKGGLFVSAVQHSEALTPPDAPMKGCGVCVRLHRKRLLCGFYDSFYNRCLYMRLHEYSVHV